MKASPLICVRVTPDIKAAFRRSAERQRVTESELLKRLLGLALGAGDLTSDVIATSSLRAPRTNRLSIRLTSQDRLQLIERARARGVPAATYISLLVHSHLGNPPALPHEELRAVTSTLNAVNALGRNLNQIARVANQGIAPDGPTPQQLVDVMQGCRRLWDQIRALIGANAKSWESKL
jgi:hypothetical protein